MLRHFLIRVIPLAILGRPFSAASGSAPPFRRDCRARGLNGRTRIANAQLPDRPAQGVLASQHHAGFTRGKYPPASSQARFRILRRKELASATQ